jgi:hypothetical protein
MPDNFTRGEAESYNTAGPAAETMGPRYGIRETMAVSLAVGALP